MTKIQFLLLLEVEDLPVIMIVVTMDLVVRVVDIKELMGLLHIILK